MQLCFVGAVAKYGSNWGYAAMRTAALLFLLTIPALAQNAVPAVAAAYGPAYDVSVGYTYLAMANTTGGSANLNGLDANGVADISRRWGGTVDAAVVGNSNILNLGHSSYVLTFLMGPVFYPLQRKNLRLSVRAMGGAGLVESAVAANQTTTLHGYVTRPSFAVGAGVEHSLWGPFAARANGDYLRTAFVDSTDTVRAQNNLRLTLSLVVRLKQRD